MPFIPNSTESLLKMVKEMGYSSFEELYDKAVPKRAQFSGCLNIPEAMSEMEVYAHLSQIASKNTSTKQLVTYLGAGIYDHYIPAAVEKITSRPEFYTAYTPYQAEVSQGTLAAIFEFQSEMTALTGMDVANASVYDGGSAIAEAINLAIAKNKKKKVLISAGVNPLYKEVIKSYTAGRKIELIDIPLNADGTTNSGKVKEILENDKDITAFVLQNPNFFGVIEDGFEFGEILKDEKALYITSVDPLSLGMITPPGEYGADIAVGEAQGLGNRMNFGGPCLGFFTIKKEFVRLMPGRVAGITKDADDERGLVLTYQTREQHIRRDKATSNICSNQQLLALAATIYLALLGDHGLNETAELCFNKAHYLAKGLSEIDDVELLYPQKSFFKEFAVKLPVKASVIVEQMAYRGILAGVDLGRFNPEWENILLVAVTEKRSKRQLDDFIQFMREGFSKP